MSTSPPVHDMFCVNKKLNVKDLEVTDTAVHVDVGPIVNIGDKTVIEGDVKTSTIYNIKLNLKGTCNLFFFCSALFLTGGSHIVRTKPVFRDAGHFLTSPTYSSTKDFMK